MKRLLFLLGFLAAMSACVAQAHEVRPGYLELRQTAPDTFDLLFKVPALSEELRLGISVTLPEGTQDIVPPQTTFSGGAHIERRTVKREGGLTGERIAIEGLSATLTDVLVRVENLGGTTQTERLTPTRTEFTIKASPRPGEVAVTYLSLGIEHILFGFDHLLFVLALVLLVRTWRRVAVTVTAFTVAHSITLAAATLGFVHVPGPPVEAAIALSIMLIAAEILNARRGHASLMLQWPWLVAFAFGLLHGLGFASALNAVGLPDHAIPLALLFFNLGVEMGQLAFVACVMLLGWTMQQVYERSRSGQGRPAFGRAEVTAAYLIGTISAYWMIERTTGFWS